MNKIQLKLSPFFCGNHLSKVATGDAPVTDDGEHEKEGDSGELDEEPNTQEVDSDRDDVSGSSEWQSKFDQPSTRRTNKWQERRTSATHETDASDNHEDDMYRSPMESSLKDEPINMFDDAQEDLAPHLRNRPDPRLRAEGDERVADLGFEPMHTENRTEPNLPPEEMIDRTFLLPPEEDGSHYCAKIME